MYIPHVQAFQHGNLGVDLSLIWASLSKFKNKKKKMDAIDNIIRRISSSLYN